MVENAPRIKEIELEGYKLPQVEVHFKNARGEFWLYPVFPTAQFIEDAFDRYKDTVDPLKALLIRESLNTQAKHKTVPPFAALFAKNLLLVRGGGTDSFFEMVQSRVASYSELLQGVSLTVPDKLQLVIEGTEETLPEAYLATIKTIGKETGSEEEVVYLDFLETAMREFEGLLRRNVGGYLGQGEINLFAILHRMQPMFANRLLAYDLPTILKEDDIELDKILTSLFAMGWGFELDSKYYGRSSAEIRQLTKRFLTLYLTALTGKVLMRQLDDTEKKKTQDVRDSEVTFSILEMVGDDGEQITIEETKLFSEESFLEKSLTEDEVQRLLLKLNDKEKDVARLLLVGYKQREIADKLGVSEAAISKKIKGIRTKIAS